MNDMTIELEGMEFYAFHGCLEKERAEGNEFVVDFKGEVNDGSSVESDCLADTLDYSEVYRVVEREMQMPSNLLEHVAGRLVKALRKEFPQLVRCSVRVSKRNPPVGGKVSWARVTVGFDRENVPQNGTIEK